MKALAGAALFGVLLALLVLFTFALHARDTCSFAQGQHRLTGSYTRCVVWNTFHNEDDDR